MDGDKDKYKDKERMRFIKETKNKRDRIKKRREDRNNRENKVMAISNN